MNRRTHNQNAAAFTLVELLVVIAIISLLIGIALPAFKRARISAKVTASQAVVSAIETGLDTFRAEDALGGQYPPSATDLGADATASERGKIMNPMPHNNPEQFVPITGASLLVYALAGPDMRGTAGFRNPAGGPWGRAMGGPGSYQLYDPKPENPDGSPRAVPPRFGPYAGEKLIDSIRPAAGTDLGKPWGLLNVDAVRPMDSSVGPLFSESIQLDKPNHLLDPIAQQLFFVDTFEQPILYYRARSAARRLLTTNVGIGVYDHRDNALITGGWLHMGDEIEKSAALKNTPTGSDDSDILVRSPTEIANETNFARYIMNARTITATSNTPNMPEMLTARPVNESRFLVISPGPDGIYGTSDDIKNWGK